MKSEVSGISLKKLSEELAGATGVLLSLQRMGDRVYLSYN